MNVYRDGVVVEVTPEEEAAILAERAEAPSLASVIARIAARRWDEVEKGAHHGGHTFDSSPDGQHAIASTVVLGREYEALAGVGSFSTVWKAKTGFLTLTVNELVQVGFAVAAHVQACFTREGALATQATGGDVAGALAALETGWPA